MGVEFKEVNPVLPVRNVARALEHYRKLGFLVKAYGDGDPADPKQAQRLVALNPILRCARGLS